MSPIAEFTCQDCEHYTCHTCGDGYYDDYCEVKAAFFHDQKHPRWQGSDFNDDAQLGCPLFVEIQDE